VRVIAKAVLGVLAVGVVVVLTWYRMPFDDLGISLPSRPTSSSVTEMATHPESQEVRQGAGLGQLPVVLEPVSVEQALEFDDHGDEDNRFESLIDDPAQWEAASQFALQAIGAALNGDEDFADFFAPDFQPVLTGDDVAGLIPGEVFAVMRDDMSSGNVARVLVAMEVSAAGEPPFNSLWQADLIYGDAWLLTQLKLLSISWPG